MENKPHVDRRTIKTKRAMHNALVELASSKPLNKITVKELTEHADVNRKTFYSHYTSIDDVLNEIEDEIIEKIIHLLEETNKNADIIRNPYYLFESVNDVITSDLDFYKNYVCSGAGNLIKVKVKKIFKETGIVLLKDVLNVPQSRIEIIMEYVSAGVIALYLSWFKGECDISLEEIAHMSGTLASSGIEGFAASHN